MEHSLLEWGKKFEAQMAHELAHSLDPAHDFAHFQRVVATAIRLAEEENANLWVVLPAAWFHDLVNVPKNDPRRSQASRLSAEEAHVVLTKMGYPSEYLAQIGHAIEAHSYSANIETKSLEAAIVQDADRLDGLGAIGLARMFSVSGQLGRRLYHPEDPFGRNRRNLNDFENTVDHFFVKLFNTVDTLKTPSGKIEGKRRADVMRTFLADLEREITL